MGARLSGCKVCASLPSSVSDIAIPNQCCSAVYKNTATHRTHKTFLVCVSGSLKLLTLVLFFDARGNSSAPLDSKGTNCKWGLLAERFANTSEERHYQ